MALYSDTRFHCNYSFVLLSLFSVVILLGSPLFGAHLAGMDVDRFLEFPPLTRYVEHAPNNLPLFLAGLFFVGAVSAWLIKRFLAHLQKPFSIRPSGYFPWWGFVGLLLLFVSWAASWGILGLPREIRMWTFTPLWFGFILFVNAFSLWLRGTCLLLRRPVAFLGLFLLSSFFWWYFEFLNRFVQNWYYVGVSSLGPIKYTAMASLAFSTVLPAVMSVNDLLQSVSAFDRAFDFDKGRIYAPSKVIATFGITFSALSLALIGLYPDYLFPFLWVSPLFVICGLRVLFGFPSLIDLAARGSFGPLARLSASGLICGFFWEMWNYSSYPKWIYSIPFVSQLKIFEMPLLGYLGYIPFGLECGAVAAFLIPISEMGPKLSKR